MLPSCYDVVLLTLLLSGGRGHTLGVGVSDFGGRTKTRTAPRPRRRAKGARREPGGERDPVLPKNADCFRDQDLFSRRDAQNAKEEERPEGREGQARGPLRSWRLRERQNSPPCSCPKHSPAPGRDPKRRSHKATKAQRRTRETPSCLRGFVTPCESQFFSCRSSRSIRGPRRSFGSHQSSLTNHQCQGPAFGRNQEHLSLAGCRRTEERLGSTLRQSRRYPIMPQTHSFT